MQPRLSNQWLSDELIEAVSRNISTGQACALDSEYATPKAPPARSQKHRRFWLRLATTLLLAGSAAFSYLAWSQADLSLQGSAISGANFSKRTVASANSTISAASPNELPAETPTAAPAAESAIEPPEKRQLAQVNALREKNWELQLRIAQLTETIKTTAH